LQEACGHIIGCPLEEENPYWGSWRKGKARVGGVGWKEGKKRSRIARSQKGEKVRVEQKKKSWKKKTYQK